MPTRPTDAHFSTRQEGVYETELRLYELEQRLAGAGFLRAGKSLLLNFDHIRALRPDFGGRLLATLSNGEKAMISRQFVPSLSEEAGPLRPFVKMNTGGIIE